MSLKRLTREESERIRVLVSAATLGPWVVDNRPFGNEICDCGCNTHVRPQTGGVLKGEAGAQADAEFIAAARSAVPALLSEIDALMTERDDLAADLARLRPLVEAVRDVVQDADLDVANCCGADSGRRQCDAYGCYSLTRLVDPLRPVLDALDSTGASDA